MTASRAPPPPDTALSPEPSPGVPGAPRPRPERVSRRRRIAILAVALVLLAAGTLDILYVIGDLPGFPKAAPSEGPSIGPTPDFTIAYQAANQSVQSSYGGDWALVGAIGLDVPAAGSYPSSTFDTGPCGPVAPPSLVRSAPGEALDGQSPYWSFTFLSRVNSSTMTVDVADGRLSRLGIAPPEGGCLPVGPVPLVAQPSVIADSSKVVGELGAPLKGFLTRFPNASVEISLLGTTIAGAQPEWVVDATPCRTSGNGSTSVAAGDPYYEGSVSGSGAALLQNANVSGLGGCLATGSFGPELTVETSRIATTPTGPGYLIEVRGASSDLAASAFHPVVLPNPAILSSPTNVTPFLLGFELLNRTTVLANYSFATGGWTSGEGTPVLAGDLLELETSQPIEGATLLLVGDAPFAGAISLTLP